MINQVDTRSTWCRWIVFYNFYRPYTHCSRSGWQENWVLQVKMCLKMCSFVSKFRFLSILIYWHLKINEFRLLIWEWKVVTCNVIIVIEGRCVVKRKIKIPYLTRNVLNNYYIPPNNRGYPLKLSVLVILYSKVYKSFLTHLRWLICENIQKFKFWDTFLPEKLDFPAI